VRPSSFVKPRGEGWVLQTPFQSALASFEFAGSGRLYLYENGHSQHTTCSTLVCKARFHHFYSPRQSPGPPRREPRYTRSITGDDDLCQGRRLSRESSETAAAGRDSPGCVVVLRECWLPTSRRRTGCVPRRPRVSGLNGYPITPRPPHRTEKAFPKGLRVVGANTTAGLSHIGPGIKRATRHNTVHAGDRV